MEKTRVMIVDDHQVVREGLRQLLELEPDIEVVGEAVNGLACVEAVKNLKPKLVFMDISMPGISGIETTRLLTERHPEVKVIILTVYKDDQYVAEAIQAGAVGYVLKDVKRDELIGIVRRVLSNQAFLDPNLTATLFDHMKKAKDVPEKRETVNLTPRELEILACLVDGMTDGQIAEHLYISEHTVRTHVKNIYRKLNVSSRSQAVTRTFQLKLITPRDSAH